MRKFVLRYTVIVLLASLPLAASSYPTLTGSYDLKASEIVPLQLDALLSFLTEWQDPSLPTFTYADQRLKEALEKENLSLEQLQGLYRMQSEQLAFQVRDQGFIVALSSSPLYSLSRTPNFTATTPPSTTFDTKHTLAVGGSVTKKLGTGGTAVLNVKESSTYVLNSSASTKWSWTHTPSVGLTVNQPLWIGDGFLDTGYGSKKLEKQGIEVLKAKLSVDQLKSGLVSQGNGLLVLLQSLLESRFLLGEQLLLEQVTLKDAQLDLEKGRISRNAYEAKTLVLNQLGYSLSEIDRQIEGVRSSLAQLWGDEAYPTQISLDPKMLSSVPDILFDSQLLLSHLLEKDPAYAQALGKLRSAELDRMMKSPSDAPMLTLSLQYSPYYAPGDGTGFFSSIGELFTGSEPTFSLSVGFSASDLFRSTTKLSSTLADEGLLQAKAEVEKARQTLETQVEQTQRDVQGLLLSLTVALNDYQLKENAVEVERIRSSVGLANESTIRIKELDRFKAAFTVLQTLRQLCLIALDLEGSGIEL